MKNMRLSKKNLQKIFGIILILLILSGLIYGGIRFIPKVYEKTYFYKKQENQKRKNIILKVYELCYGDNVYLITSADYWQDYSYSNITLNFSPDNDKTDDTEVIWFTSGDKPLKVKLIKTFISKEDTTSFIKIK